MPVAGVGYLSVNDILTDAAYVLLQPSVKTTVPIGGIFTGIQTVKAWHNAMYAGAQIIVGSIGSGDVEVVTITSVVQGSSFTATFTNPHSAGEPIVGATFPVRQTSDPLFTQAEMIAYLSTALAEYLTEVPLAYAVDTITVNGSQQNTALPSDCMFPVRVAYNGTALRETSQSNLDSMDQNWAQSGASTPRAYFRDKIPMQNIGIFPRAANKTALELVYAQRQAQTLGLSDGFMIPDPFLLYVLFRTLSFAFSKDGEARNPGLAKYFESRYKTGVMVSKMVLGVVEDPNSQAVQPQ